jgi:membrane protein
LLSTLKQSVREFREHNLTDWAAALTYYGLLSLFPATIALVSLLGLFGDPQRTTDSLTEIIRTLGPDSAARTFEGPIDSVIASRGAAGFALFFGLAVALWSASGYLGAFVRASNVIYETEEERSFWKLRPLQLAVTLAAVLAVALLALGLVLTGPIVAAIAEPVGVGDTAVGIWNVAKWPAMAAVFVLVVDLLYYVSPDAGLPGFSWVTPGCLVALAAWVLASAGFALYVSNFGSYDKTYGTLAGVVVLLVWLWIGNLAILFGHQLNAVRRPTPMAK